MRIAFLIFWIGLVTSLPLQAQEKLSDITAPSSPASALLDVQSQTVLTPKSYRALETALYSNFLNSTGEGVIPNDLALEFTPYWTKDRSLSVQEYLYPKNVWRGQIVRNSSFSMATTQNFSLGDSSVTSAIALGYRTTLNFGNKQDREIVETQLSEIRQNMRIQARIGAPVNRLALDENIQTKAEFIQASRNILFSAISRTYPSYSSDEVETLVNLVLDEA
ncbi:MAG: hypothetical protein R3220_03635, partial [Balneolaceae bacterium]|nr:hypothetical protein [Balneolaceae bacterium]